MSRAPIKLVTLNVSPWSERARWALDHHRLPYQNLEHVPFLGERRLRRLVGKTRGRATVPVLLTGEHTLTESWDIALYADREGQGEKLIPADRAAQIRTWNDTADQTMSAGRALVVRAMLASPEALEEGLPPDVPRFLRPLLRPVTRYGMKWFGAKYGLDLERASEQTATLRTTLQTLRQALSTGSPYLLGTFSYADIVMATCLQGVSPVENHYIPLGPATRKAWTLPTLSAEFPDLITWRNNLYDQHRRPT